MNDAIEAAALAISVYDWNRGLSSNPEVNKHQRAEATVAINAAEAIIRADERAKVAEEIRAHLTADADDESARPSRDAHSRLIETWLREAAAIALQHAVQGSARHQDAPNGPDAYPSEGAAVPSPQKAAQEGER